jgi:transcription elongation GreA/GreB family factor
MIDKRTLVAALRAQISAEIEAMSRLAREAAEAATHEENKPENDKDMRSTEASYLARGQAERVRDLERAHALLGAMPLESFGPDRSIGASAIVELRIAGKTSRCFLVPAGGGLSATIDGVEIKSVTTSSPLGEALVGLLAGDEAEVPTPQGTKVYEIVSVG